MAKQHQEMQAASDGRNMAVSQRILIDNNPLPSSEELAKLKEIDPSIVSWFLQRSDAEQKSRLKMYEEELAFNVKFNLERLGLTKKEQSIVLTSLWLAFAIAISFLALSGILIYSGMEIAGSIFGGAALILCVQAFLKFGRKQKQ